MFLIEEHNISMCSYRKTIFLFVRWVFYCKDTFSKTTHCDSNGYLYKRQTSLYHI